MTHVANILEINVSTLTTTINKLVKKGYVERLRDDKDRRIVKIGLSEKGIAAATERDSFMGELLRGAVEQVEPDKLRYFISAIDNINQYFMAKSSMSYLKTTPFALEPLQLGKRDLPVPIVQAGMSLGIAGPKLASAVAEEGGLGLIGASDIGWQREDFARDRMEANVKALQEKVAEALKRRKKRSGKGLIGVSVLWGNPAAREYVKAAAKSGAEVIVASGLPTDLPKYCTDKNIALIPVVSSRRGAAAIVRNWTAGIQPDPGCLLFCRVLLLQDFLDSRRSSWTGQSRNGAGSSRMSNQRRPSWRIVRCWWAEASTAGKMRNSFTNTALTGS